MPSETSMVCSFFVVTLQSLQKQLPQNRCRQLIKGLYQYERFNLLALPRDVKYAVYNLLREAISKSNQFELIARSWTCNGSAVPPPCRSVCWIQLSKQWIPTLVRLTLCMYLSVRSYHGLAPLAEKNLERANWNKTGGPGNMYIWTCRKYQSHGCS
jgi:hypothetical protein